SSSRRLSCASRVTAPGSGADRERPEAPCPPNRSQRNAGKTDAEEVGAPSAILPLRRRGGKFKAAPRYFRTAPAPPEHAYGRNTAIRLILTLSNVWFARA